MTERLYYQDSYLRKFTATVVRIASDGQTVYLDRTAFYPASGGQPYDTGAIAGVRVTEVVDEGERIAHRLAGTVTQGAAACHIDWGRRFDHMQQHSGQHLLSAVFEELFRLRTVSFHMGEESSTIDLEGGAVDGQIIRQAEARANDLVFENRPVRIEFENAAQVQGLRKASEREGTLRIISIEGLDRSACGGTHVRATGEIGPVLIRKTEKIRQMVRVEFLCGGRAVRRARADFEGLAKIAQLYSTPLDEAPALAAAQIEAARVSDKARNKLELELARYRGRELYLATGPDAGGFRRHRIRLASGSMEEQRALAQSFTAQPKAVFVALIENPPSVLYAVSADAGIDAGQALKAAFAEAGGRGGGSARLAQGSVPEAGLLDPLSAKLA